MKNEVPRRPLPLALYLEKLLAGDEKHAQEGALTTGQRADLSARKAKLDSMNTAVQLALGAYRKAAQDRKEFVQETAPATEQVRDLVYGKYGKDSEVLVDFGLSARRKAHRGPNAEGATQSAAAKAARSVEKAQVKLFRAQSEYQKAQERLSRAEARLSRREAQAAIAGPLPSSEPTPPPSVEP